MAEEYFNPDYSYDFGYDDAYSGQTMDPNAALDAWYADAYQGLYDSGSSPANLSGADLAIALGEGMAPITSSEDQASAVTDNLSSLGAGVNLAGELSGIAKALEKMGVPKKLAALMGSPQGLLTGLAGLIAAKSGAWTPQTGGYKGTVPTYKATRTRLPTPEYKPYTGQPVMGRRFFSDVSYEKSPDVVTAAAGGIMAAKGRYLRGDTDGMADELYTSIDGKQPARLSHGEFVVPADVVSHLGNGNSDAGAKALYKMMERVRKARTGTKRQGRQINPSKFMPGGLAGYAHGGIASFQTGGSTGTGVTSSAPLGTTATTSLSEWAGPTVTDLIGRGTALAATPYEAYDGPLTAGYSPLQTAAFEKIGQATTPQGIIDAGKAASEIAKSAAGVSYSPGKFSNTFSAPGKYQAAVIENPYQKTATYTPTTGFDKNFYEATGEYVPVSSSFTEEGVADKYMNPFLEKILQPQLQALQREADIKRNLLGAQAAKAGAFGGDRAGLMEAQLNAELMRQKQQTTGSAYEKAFAQAQQQFNAEEARKVDEAKFAMQAGMTTAEAVAKYGLAAVQGAEQSRQFGATQALENARAEAQYGLTAKDLSERSRQFASTQEMLAAQEAAKYGLAARQAAEQSKQFGAKLGLDALATQLQAANLQGTLGTSEATIQQNQLAQLLGAGNIQRAIEQEGINAAKAEFEAEKKYPFTMLQFEQSLLSNLPVGTTSVTPNSSLISQIAQAGSDMTKVYKILDDYLKANPQ